MPATSNDLPLEIHPINAFQLPPKQNVVDWSSYQPPGEWLKPFAMFLWNHQSVMNRGLTHEVIFKELTRQLDPSLGNFAYLIKRVPRLYQFMDEILSKKMSSYAYSTDNIPGLVDRILEGIRFCNHGFFERISAIWDVIESDLSIESLLHLYRHELVEEVAHENLVFITYEKKKYKLHPGNEVHEVDRYFRLASAMGKGVDCSGDLTAAPDDGLDVERVRKIDEKFAEEYCPLLMIKAVEERIRSALFNLGKFDQGQPEKDKSAVMHQWMAYLNLVFKKAGEQEPPFNLEHTWLYDDEYHVIDINWHYVREQIYNYLLEKAIIFGPSFDVISEWSPSNKKERQYWTLAFSSFKLDENEPVFSGSSYTDRFDLLGMMVAKQLDNPVVDEHVFRSFVMAQLDVLFAVFKQCPSLFDKLHHHQAWSKILLVLSFEEVQSKSYFGELLALAALSQPFSELITNLDALTDKAQLFTILSGCYFSQQESILLLGAQHQPVIVDKLMAIIKTFTPREQEKVLFSSNKAGDTPFLMALKKKISIESFLKIAQQVDEQTLRSLFLDTTADGSNALMLALEHNASAVPSLLTIIDQFDTRDRYKILKTVDNLGRNALLIAALENKEICGVINRIAKLNCDARDRLFSHVYYQYHPTFIRGTAASFAGKAIDRTIHELKAGYALKKMNTPAESFHLMDIILTRLLMMDNNPSGLIKKAKVLTVLQGMKSSTDSHLTKELEQPDSELYKALNMHRSMFACFFVVGGIETRTLKLCKAHIVNVKQSLPEPSVNSAP